MNIHFFLKTCLFTSLGKIVAVFQIFTTFFVQFNSLETLLFAGKVHVERVVAIR